jgi:hypothetical protein
MQQAKQSKMRSASEKKNAQLRRKCFFVGICEGKRHNAMNPRSNAQIKGPWQQQY